MKKILIFFLSMGTLTLLGQCPVGDVELNSQADVDDFALNFPNCTQIAGNLTIDSQSEENFINNLTGLSSLEVIEGSLIILKIDRLDELTNEIIPGSLIGLNGLESVNELIIGEDGLFSSFHIESLAPLSNLSGAMNRIILSGTTFYEPMPDFSALESLDEFAWRNCNGVASTPQFSNLTSINRFTAVGNNLLGDSLITIAIPNVESIASPGDDQAFSGVSIQDCQSLENILGGDGLSFIRSVVLTSNNSLANLSAFDGVTEVKRLVIEACSESSFHSFPNLGLADQIEFYPNRTILGCGEFQESFMIRVGEEANALVAIEEGLIIEGNNIGNLHFTAQFEKLGGLSIETENILEIDGFSSLDSVVNTSTSNGIVFIYGLGLNSLPDFGNLSRIDYDLRLILGDEISGVVDMESFSALEFIGKELNLNVNNLNTTFTSLDGLESLIHCRDITIAGAHALEDVSALTNLEYLSDLKLYDLLSFDTDISFEGVENIAVLRLSQVGLETFPSFPNLVSIGVIELLDSDNLLSTPSFPNLESMGSLYVTGCDNMSFISGYPSLQTLNRLDLIDNEILEEINLPVDLTYTGNWVEWTYNPLLSDCGNSPVICNIVSQTDPALNYIFINGDGCNFNDNIAADCLLSTEQNQAFEFNVWIDQSGNLAFRLDLTDPVNLRIISSTGQMVKSLTGITLSHQGSIEISKLSSGVYFVEVSTRNARSVQKIVIL